MKLITRDTDYAVRAICFMTKNKGKIVSVTELVKVLKAPRPFLRKILQILNRERILKSYKGTGGGFTLAKPYTQIPLLDLIKIFQGDFKLNECLFKGAACPNRSSCALRKKIGLIENFALERLKSITIASLLE